MLKANLTVILMLLIFCMCCIRIVPDTPKNEKHEELIGDDPSENVISFEGDSDNRWSQHRTNHWMDCMDEFQDDVKKQDECIDSYDPDKNYGE